MTAAGPARGFASALKVPTTAPSSAFTARTAAATPAAPASHLHALNDTFVPLVVACLTQHHNSPSTLSASSSSSASGAGDAAAVGAWYPSRAESARVSSLSALVGAARWGSWVASLSSCPSFTTPFWTNLLQELNRRAASSASGLMELQPSDVDQFIAVWHDYDSETCAEYLQSCDPNANNPRFGHSANSSAAGHGEEEEHDTFPTPRRAFDFSSPAQAPATAGAARARTRAAAAADAAAAESADSNGFFPMSPPTHASSANAHDASASAMGSKPLAAEVLTGTLSSSYTPARPSSAASADSYYYNNSDSATASSSSTALTTVADSSTAATAVSLYESTPVPAWAVASGSALPSHDSHRVTAFGFDSALLPQVRAALEFFGPVTATTMTAAMSNWAVVTFASPAAARAALARSGRLTVAGRVIGVQPFLPAHTGVSAHGAATALASAHAGAAVVLAARSGELGTGGAGLGGGDGSISGIDCPGAGAFAADLGAVGPLSSLTAAAAAGGYGARARGAAGAGRAGAGPVGYAFDDEAAVAARVVDVDVFADATTQRRLRKMSTCQKIVRFVLNC